MDPHEARAVALLPRFIRARDAHGYCGMCRAVFNQELRPHLTEIPIGRQGLAFDRLELDAALGRYKYRNGRPARKGGNSIWDAEQCVDSPCEEASGTSTKGSEDLVAFAKALERATGRKRNDF